MIGYVKVCIGINLFIVFTHTSPKSNQQSIQISRRSINETLLTSNEWEWVVESLGSSPATVYFKKEVENKKLQHAIYNPVYIYSSKDSITLQVLLMDGLYA